MKKYFLLIGFVLVLFPTVAYAHYDPAYLRSINEFNHSQNSWMANIRDDVKLSRLSVPGTHDSMSNGPGGDIAQNQGLSLSEQLDVGIRFLDIRVRAIDGVFTIHHGPIYLNKNFGDVLNAVKEFLCSHPTETVYMRVKQEYSEVNNTEVKNIFNKYIGAECYKDLFYNGRNSNPTLGDTRSKVVLMYDGFYPSVGLSYNSCRIQDQYRLNTNWDLYSKWIAVKNQLSEANNSNGQNIYINYLTGSTGSFPYFVASGHSSPGTGAPRLATGLTHPGWAGSYPDFPRVNWFLGIATIAFEGTNILTADYINNNNLTYSGIVVADFPGYRLIDEIIKANKLNYKYHNFYR